MPAHLKPVKVQYCKEVKREMKNMWMAMRQAAEAETEEEMPNTSLPSLQRLRRMMSRRRRRRTIAGPIGRSGSTPGAQQRALN